MLASGGVVLDEYFLVVFDGVVVGFGSQQGYVFVLDLLGSFFFLVIAVELFDLAG